MNHFSPSTKLQRGCKGMFLQERRREWVLSSKLSRSLLNFSCQWEKKQNKTKQRYMSITNQHSLLSQWHILNSWLNIVRKLLLLGHTKFLCFTHDVMYRCRCHAVRLLAVHCLKCERNLHGDSCGLPLQPVANDIWKRSQSVDISAAAPEIWCTL